MTAAADITKFEHGNKIELDRTAAEGIMICTHRFSDDRSRTIVFEPSQVWTCSDYVDPDDKLCNEETRKIRTDYANSFQTEPKPQFRLAT